MNLKLFLFLSIIPVALFGQSKPGWHNDSDSDHFAKAAAIVRNSSDRDPLPFQPLTAPLVTQQSSSSSTVGNEADEITPEIEELARGLRHDPVEIFEYCHNYIDYEHYFGSKKGATLTLIEGSGNSFDTAALMVALLRASGYEASYRYGPRDLFDDEIADWLGLWYYGDDGVPFPHWTDTEFRSATGTTGDERDTLTLRLLFHYILYHLDRGFPAVDPTYEGILWYVPNVWVQFEVGGTTYEADPSYKTLLPASTTIDLEAVTGYDRTTVLNEIGQGSSQGSGYVKDLNGPNLASRLTTYTTALTQWLRDNRPNSPVDQLIGTRNYARGGFETLSDLPTVYYGENVSYLPVETWDAIPTQWMAKLSVTAGEYDYANESFTTTRFSATINMPALRGRKISLVFDGGDDEASLYLDESPFAAGATFSVPKADTDLRFDVDHPHGTYDTGTGVWTDDGSHDQSETKAYRKADNFAYIILYGFDPSGRLLRNRQAVLDAYLRDPAVPDDSWMVTTELLNIMGLNWLLQTQLSDEIIAGQYNADMITHHAFGRMAQEEGYYVDVGLQFSGLRTYDSNYDNQTDAFHLQTLYASALEHALIEQMQGEDKNGISTVKILQLANEQGLRVYRADSSNWPSVRSHLAGKGYDNSTGGTLDDLGDTINNEDGVVLIPEEPSVPLDQWAGTGYSIFSESDSFFAGMIISGGYFGGYLSQPDTLDIEPVTDFGFYEPGYFDTISSGLIYGSDPVTTPAYYGADPVDMASGAFVYDRTDLQLGRAAPRGLSFARHYNSNRRYDKSRGLGYGWTHNFDIRIAERSSIKAGLGETVHYQMAPFLASIAVAKDLYAGNTSAKEWLGACLAIDWATDQLLYKSVAVTMGQQTVEFVEMPDGSYAPPAGITMELSEDGSGNYVLQQRHGNTYTLDPENRIDEIEDQHGFVQDFSYNGDKLTQVGDGYGRTLTLTWTGEKITGVADSTGRSVTYTYNGDDLTSVNDPDGHDWTFVYDAEHRIAELRDPQSRIIVQNTYDAKSRVESQLSEGDPDKTWNLYYTGYVNTEEDPEGGATRYFYDERGRSVGVENALGEADGRGYDGQDHMTVHSTPKLEFTLRDYDADHNLTKITDPLFNESVHTYDAQNRRETEGDFKGNDTTYTHNAQHQVLTVTDRKGNLIRTNTYYANGDLHTSTDADSNTTTYSYDSFGNVSRIDHPDTTFETFVYNARGDLTSHTDRRGHTTTHSYDNRRNRLVTTYPDSSTVTRAIGPSGNLVSVTDNEGNTTTHTYSATKKRLTTTLPATAAGSAVIENTYDDRDWLASTEDPLDETTTFTRDAAGRLTGTTDPLGRTNTKTFDENGQVLTRANPENETSEFTYNARGERTVATNPLDHDVAYAFDANGNRTGINNRRSQDYTFAYDPNDRQLTLETPLGHTTTQTWNDRGLLAVTAQIKTDQNVRFAIIRFLPESQFAESKSSLCGRIHF